MPKSLPKKSFWKWKQDLALLFSPVLILLNLPSCGLWSACGFVLQMATSGKKQWWSYVKLLINWAALLPCDWYLAADSGTAFPQCLRSIIYGRVIELQLLCNVLVRLCNDFHKWFGHKSGDWENLSYIYSAESEIICIFSVCVLGRIQDPVVTAL